MSYRCVTVDERVIHWPFAPWVYVIYLAYDYGWTALGTEPPPEWIATPEMPVWSGNVWSGNYGANSGALVTAADAHALGTILTQALPDIPEIEAIAPDRLVIHGRGGPMPRVLMRYDADGAHMGNDRLPAELGDPDDLPDLLYEGDTPRPIVTWTDTEVGRLREGPSLSSLVLLSGARRPQVAEFARLCQLGAFHIW